MKEVKIENTVYKIYKNQKIKISDLENFAIQLKKFTTEINSKQREEHLKYLLRDFLKNTFYQNNAVNTKDNFDFAIHLDKTDNSKIGIIIETKTPDSKEMLTKNNFQLKSMYQSLLYYLQERIGNKNNDLKHIIITNFYQWFIFDASDFEKLFYENKELQKEFKNWNDNRKTSKTTNLFYNEIAPKYIEQAGNSLEYIHIDIKNIDTNIEKNQKKLINLYKIFSDDFLLKKHSNNDGNTLDKKFYYELLHIIGLEEQKDKGKKIITRKKEKQYGSLIENTILTIKAEERIEFVEDIEHYGKNTQEQLENIALELNIMWVNRILFLKLLEAQLITYHNKNNDYKFLNSASIKDFAELNELFFEVLALKNQERPIYIKEKFKKIPYLNSSLFEYSKLEKQTIRINSLKDRLQLPLLSNTVLKNISDKSLPVLQYFFKFLDAYDFTSVGADQVQKEQKNLINASVLGLIFEKINGYKEGSFFTPGHITMHISRKTIRKAVVQKFRTLPKFKTLAKFDELKDKIEDRQQANKIINNLKICDPSVGSGHFLVSALNEILAIKSELGILQYRNSNKIKDYKIEIINDELIVTDKQTEEIFEYNLTDKGNIIDYKQELQEALFHEKQTIIENCLFGVDINPNSVNICRLRLWIELLKNSYYIRMDAPSGTLLQLQTLPNIDINIKQGNSLISRFSLNGIGIRNGQAQKMRLATRKYKEQVVIYKSTNDKSIKQNAENKILEIKKEFIKVINPTDEDFKTLQKLKGKLIEISSQSPILMTDEDKKIWQHNLNTLPLRIDELEKEYQKKIKTIYENAFEWRFEFPEILDEKGDFIGFDAVIGNPPYLNFKMYSKEERNIFKINYPEIFDGKADIYYFFFYKALHILKPAGILSFITSRYWLEAKFAGKLRKYISNHYQIDEIIDFKNVTIFDGVGIKTSIAEIIKNNVDNNFYLNYRFTSKKKINTESLNDFVTITVKYNEIKNKANWLLRNGQELSILKKIEENSKTLDEIAYCKQGIVTGLDKAFVTTKNEFDDLPKKIIKTWIKVGDIHKYFIKPTEKRQLVYTNEIKNIADYPDLEKHLLKFKTRLSKRREAANGKIRWFDLQWSRTNDLFESPKIICRFKAAFNTFTLDENNIYSSADTTIVKLKKNTTKEFDIKYLLGLLNSTLLDFYFKSYGKLMDYRYEYYPGPVGFLRIKNSKEQNSIIKIVNEIIKIKDENTNEDIVFLEKEIDKIVYKIYGLNKREIEIVEENKIDTQ